jgi:hypothetical protein
MPQIKYMGWYSVKVILYGLGGLTEMNSGKKKNKRAVP